MAPCEPAKVTFSNGIGCLRRKGAWIASLVARRGKMSILKTAWPPERGLARCRRACIVRRKIGPGRSDMAQDFEIIEKTMAFQGYFRIDRYRFRHRLFAGGWSGEVRREVLER